MDTPSGITGMNDQTRPDEGQESNTFRVGKGDCSCSEESYNSDFDNGTVELHVCLMFGKVDVMR